MVIVVLFQAHPVGKPGKVRHSVESHVRTKEMQNDKCRQAEESQFIELVAPVEPEDYREYRNDQNVFQSSYADINWIKVSLSGFVLYIKRIYYLSVVQSQTVLDPKPFLAFCRNLIPAREVPPQGGKVVLTSLLGLPSILVNQFLLANHLAAKQQVSIEGFDFTGAENEVTTQFLEALGGLQFIALKDCIPLKAEDITLIAEWRAGIKSKRQFLEMCFDELRVGDLIYNSYCRYYIAETLDLDDERLWGLVEHSLGIYRLMGQFFETNDVCQVLLDHPSYFRSGIICRMACARKIPVLVIGTRMNVRRLGGDVDSSGCQRTNFASLPWRLFRSLFEQLPSDQQETARLWARGELTKLLGLGTSPGEGAWKCSSHAKDGPPIFRESGKPRMLVLPPDFCDEIHRYGRLIHVDFYEWLENLLMTASETDFDWYVKMHPENPRQVERTALNHDVLNRFEQRFPKVTFLPSTTSNSQMVAEGIRTVFTVRGSPVHEFAYQGIPVVCGGDTMHMSFDFSLKPQSREELEKIIRSADQASVNIDQSEVEAFYYTNNYYFNRFGGEHIAKHKKTEFILQERYVTAKSHSDFFNVLMSFFDEAAWKVINDSFDAFLESPGYSGDDLAKAQLTLRAQ